LKITTLRCLEERWLPSYIKLKITTLRCLEERWLPSFMWELTEYSHVDITCITASFYLEGRFCPLKIAEPCHVFVEVHVMRHECKWLFICVLEIMKLLPGLRFSYSILEHFWWCIFVFCCYVYNITIILFNCTFISNYTFIAVRVTRVKWKKTKGQTTIYKTLHIKLKIK
jgi:hypothetical protein